MCGVHPVQRLSMLTAVINWAWANLKKTRVDVVIPPARFFFFLPSLLFFGCQSVICLMIPSFILLNFVFYDTNISGKDRLRQR